MIIRDKIELVNIKSITPYDKNAKLHSQDQIDKLANVISQYGWDQPIVIDENNIIIKGHGRLEAAKKLGLQSVPIIRVSDLTTAQKKALRLADNKLAESNWDDNLLKLDLEELKSLDFNIEELGFNNIGVNDPNLEYTGMPEFEQNDLLLNRLIVLFENDIDRIKFSELINIKLNNMTKSIWFPEKLKESMKDFVYINDS